MTKDSGTTIPRTRLDLIRYPRLDALHKDIRLCQEMSRCAGEPSCMALEGVTGAGKSTLVETYAEAFARYETAAGTKIPVFYLETPSPVTVKGMAARMLEKLGDPASSKGALWSMNSRLIHYLKLCEVELVILDDFHHLIDRETHRVLETVSDWLKVLIKETKIPYLVVGIEGSVEQILQANSQLSRLFAVRETLHPFSWNVSDLGTIEEFAAFIKVAEQRLGMHLSDELPRAELLARLYYATDGVVGNIMILLRSAVLLTRQEGADTITLSVLARAFSKHLLKRMAKSSNPFTVEPDKPFNASETSRSDSSDNVGRKSKRRKERKLTAAQVLTTR